MPRRSSNPRYPLAGRIKFPAGQASVLLLAAAALLAVSMAEAIQRNSLSAAWEWMLHNRHIFALNGLLAFGLMLGAYAVIGSIAPSAACVLLLLSAASLISFYKTRLIGEPFYPWDLFLNKEGLNIAPLVTEKSAWLRIGALTAVLLAVLSLRPLLRRFKPSLKGRLLWGLLSLMLLVSFGTKAPWAERWLDRAGVSEIIWNQQENYSNNGLLLAFSMNVKNAVIPKPAGYNEQSVGTIAGLIARDRAASTSLAAAAPGAAGGIMPNVIFIMNEAFWDPTRLPGLTFSQDPAPTLHRLQQDPHAATGYLLSPQFGGGTSNVEFEVLTGLNMSFLPAGSVPYQQYISKPTPSLAGYFAGLGYKSAAIHSYEGWFWNREKVYKWMGFDSFKDKSRFVEPEYDGAFIADSEVSRSIIQAVKDSEQPLFVYAVTMQNHGPYEDNRYGDDVIRVEGSLTASAKQAVETYSRGVFAADRSLQQLIGYFEESGEPTVIVFYGDHLPMLGYDYDVYKQTGFISTERTEHWTLEELERMRSVPYAVWSNFPLAEKPGPVLSYSFLGSAVLKSLGLEAPAQFAFHSDLAARVPVLLRNLVIDSQGNRYGAVPEEARAPVDQYRILQYDLLFGKTYLAGYLDQDYLTRGVASDYNQEFQTLADGADRSGSTDAK